MNIAEALGVGIPTADAAAFFLKVKTAGWTDPPDETGELEGQFAVPIEQAMEKMRAVVVAKFRKMVAYQVYSNSLRSLEHHSISREFDHHGWQEKDMADKLMRRLATLGGPIQLDDIEPPPASSNAVEIIKRMIRAEQEGIAAQRDLLVCIGPDNPMKHMVEEMMSKDQYHTDELWQMLPTEHHAPIIDIGAGQAGTQEQVVDVPPSEGEEAVPQEPPVEEKVAQLSRGLVELAGMGSAGALAGRGAETSGGAAARGALGGGLAGAGMGALNFARIGKGLPAKLMLIPVAAGGAFGAAGGALSGLAAKKLKDREKEKEGAVKVAKTLKEVESETRKKYRRMGGKAGLRAGAKKGGKRGLGFGALGGALGGAAAGVVGGAKKGLKGALLGGAVGGLAGGAGGAALGGAGGAVKGRKKGKAVGETIGQMVNIRRRQWLMRKASREKRGSVNPITTMRFGLALHKLAQGPDMAQGMAPPGPPQPAEPAGADGAATLPPTPQKPPSGPPVVPPTMPTNYLAAEQMAQQAQGANEARFYQGKLQQNQDEMQGMQQQIQEVQGQLQQLEQQAAESSSQIQQATQQAVAAQDEATAQTMEAAKLRMGAQKMRAQMLEIASQEPEQLAAETMPAAPGAMPPGAETEQGPAEKTGPAGKAPSPGAGVAQDLAPGGVGEGEGVEPEVATYEQQAAGAEPQTALKTAAFGQLAMKQLAARAPYALGGAALGAGGAAIQAARAPGIEERSRASIGELEGQTGQSFGASLRLAKAKAQLGEAEHLQAHQGKSILMGGLKGAALGALAGPTAGEQTARGVGALKGKLKQIFG